MMELYNTKFGIQTYKDPKGWWSFGINLSHSVDETYLHINFFRWHISIGILYMEEEEYFIDQMF